MPRLRLRKRAGPGAEPITNDLTNGRLLLGASPSKDVRHHVVVPLMTSVLVDFVGGPFEPNRSRPGRRPRRGVRQRDFVVDPVDRRACKALDHVEVLGRSEKAALWRKVRGLDNQRVALPSTARVPEPEADVL